MNARVKRRWIKALRSGEYKQGRHDLINEDGYCCLGVMAAEMVPEFVRLPGEPGNGAGCVLVQGDQVYGTPPADLTATWGITGFEVTDLIYMNDVKGWSFRRIATWIERNL